MRETMVTVSGNVVTDPILRVLESGSYVLSFRIASNSRKYDQNSQEWVDGSSLYLSVSCWGKLALHAQDALHKGKAVIVTGSIRTHEFIGSDGIKRSSVELKASDLGLSLSRQRAQYLDVDDYDLDQKNPIESMDNFETIDDTKGIENLVVTTRSSKKKVVA